MAAEPHGQGHDGAGARMNDWLTPRDGFRQIGLGRFLLMLVQAVALIAVAVIVMFALALENVR